MGARLHVRRATSKKKYVFHNAWWRNKCYHFVLSRKSLCPSQFSIGLIGYSLDIILRSSSLSFPEKAKQDYCHQIAQILMHLRSMKIQLLKNSISETASKLGVFTNFLRV